MIFQIEGLRASLVFLRHFTERCWAIGIWNFIEFVFIFSNYMSSLCVKPIPYCSLTWRDENNSPCFLSSSYVPDILLSALCLLIHLIFTTVLWDHYSCFHQFPDKETEAQSDEIIRTGHTAGRWWDQDSNPRSLAPKRHSEWPSRFSGSPYTWAFVCFLCKPETVSSLERKMPHAIWIRQDLH